MKRRMSYKSITRKLNVGMALADRAKKAQKKIDVIRAKQIALASAKKTRQLGDFGQGNLIAQLQDGSLFPDSLYGWSTKSILAITLALLLFKLKQLRG